MKPCKQCQKQFEITDSDRAFYNKMDVPEPTHCPSCRRMRRLSFVNQYMLYKRKSDFSGKEILSVLKQWGPCKVYANDEYWKDTWDAYQYGRDFDFSRPFFEQFNELFTAVPKQPMEAAFETMENSDYCMLCGHLKDCYMTIFADFDDRCLYTLRSSHCKDVVDSEGCYECELCYQCTKCEKCYNSKYLFQCSNCLDTYFSYDCINCQNCFGCFNLKNKQYYIYNEQKMPEEYKKFINSINFGSRKEIEKIKKEVAEKTKNRKVRAYFGIKNEDVSGNYINNSKNAHYCFDVRGAENVKYCDSISLAPAKDIMDFYSWGNGAELVYDSISIGEGGYNIRWCYQCWPACQNMEYCTECHSSEFCFGCVGLKKGQYSILNKKYSKEEYFNLHDRIIKHMKETGEWGEFFPMWMSPFAYNESIAGVEYMPMSKDEAIGMGLKWEENTPGTFGKETKKQTEVPDDINNISEEFAKELLACIDCGKNYKVIKQEIVFYKKMNIPVPEKCYLCKFKDHFKKLSGYNLYDRECFSCGKVIQTTYAPDRPEKVLCEICYNKEVN